MSVDLAHLALGQFDIKPISLFGHDVTLKIGNLDISFSNSALWMALAVALVVFSFRRAFASPTLVPNRLQSLIELMFGFVDKLMTDNVGIKAKPYFPFVLSIFLFVLLCNVLGLIPGSFTPTSHIIVTFALAFTVFTVVTVIGFMKHGAHFLHFFVPEGAPGFVMPILVPIEIVSYLIRPFSLSIRLFANMLAGHMIIKIFAGFAVMLGLFGIVPGLAIAMLTGLELLVAFLQAYVFTMLTCLYLKDALEMH